MLAQVVLRHEVEPQLGDVGLLGDGSQCRDRIVRGVGGQRNADHAPMAPDVCPLAVHGLMVRARILDCNGSPLRQM